MDLENAEDYIKRVADELPTAVVNVATALIARVRELEQKSVMFSATRPAILLLLEGIDGLRNNNLRSQEDRDRIERMRKELHRMLDEWDKPL